ncbi:hypothetical protein MJO29_013606 [Puccinia striiformis f. sp. tritici]|nr:hypothetical protein MJO29_013606 [Puccinia striiformis f. sp. tritici]
MDPNPAAAFYRTKPFLMDLNHVLGAVIPLKDRPNFNYANFQTRSPGFQPTQRSRSWKQSWLPQSNPLIECSQSQHTTRNCVVRLPSRTRPLESTDLKVTLKILVGLDSMILKLPTIHTPLNPTSDTLKDHAPMNLTSITVKDHTPVSTSSNTLKKRTLKDIQKVLLMEAITMETWPPMEILCPITTMIQTKSPTTLPLAMQSTSHNSPLVPFQNLLATTHKKLVLRLFSQTSRNPNLTWPTTVRQTAITGPYAISHIDRPAQASTQDNCSHSPQQSKQWLVTFNNQDEYINYKPDNIDHPNLHPSETGDEDQASYYTSDNSFCNGSESSDGLDHNDKADFDNLHNNDPVFDGNGGGGLDSYDDGGGYGDCDDGGGYGDGNDGGGYEDFDEGGGYEDFNDGGGYEVFDDGGCGLDYD